MEHYFIIRNDVTNYYNISEHDSEIARQYKETMRARNFAIYNSSTRHWTINLPSFFWNSSNPNKCIVVESFQYYKPDGSCDIGTTFHSNTLIDTDFSQFDNMIGLSTLGINRTFPISNKPQQIEFYFKDYLSNECLEETELMSEQKINEEGKLLYYDDDGNETTEETVSPVIIEVQKPVSFIIMTKLIC